MGWRSLHRGRVGSNSARRRRREWSPPAGTWLALSLYERTVGLDDMSNIRPMPQAAKRAAIETFARVTRERHPDMVVIPLFGVGTNGSVVAAPTRQVIRPFAAPEDSHSILDRDSRVTTFDHHRIDGAPQDSLAILDG